LADAVEKGFLTLDRRRAFQKWAHMEKVDPRIPPFRSLLLRQGDIKMANDSGGFEGKMGLAWA
jgi:hypothetical protein